MNDVVTPTPVLMLASATGIRMAMRCLAFTPHVKLTIKRETPFTWPHSTCRSTCWRLKENLHWMERRKNRGPSPFYLLELAGWGVVSFLFAITQVCGHYTLHCLACFHFASCQRAHHRKPAASCTLLAFPLSSLLDILKRRNINTS